MTKKFRVSTKVMTIDEGKDKHEQNNWYWKEIAEVKTVTDKMEDRNSLWKADYARKWFMKKHSLKDYRLVTVTEI